MLALANKVYDVWAANRTQLTGRESLPKILEKRRQLEAEGRASCRVPATSAASSSAQCE